MNCPKCNKEIDKEFKYCNNCGAKLEEVLFSAEPIEGKEEIKEKNENTLNEDIVAYNDESVFKTWFKAILSVFGVLLCLFAGTMSKEIMESGLINISFIIMVFIIGGIIYIIMKKGFKMQGSEFSITFLNISHSFIIIIGVLIIAMTGMGLSALNFIDAIVFLISIVLSILFYKKHNKILLGIITLIEIIYLILNFMNLSTTINYLPSEVSSVCIHILWRILTIFLAIKYLIKKKIIADENVVYNDVEKETSTVKTEKILDETIVDNDINTEADTIIAKEEVKVEDDSKGTESVENYKNGRTNNKTKKIFCKKCGGEVDNVTKECTKCGRQYFRFKFKAPAIIMAVLIIVLGGLNVWQFIVYKNDIAEKNSIISGQEEEVIILKNELKTLKGQNSLLELSRIANEATIRFYEEYAAIVPDDGKRMYHVYGCEDFDADYFWIYNYNAAEQKGYYPCPKCH